MILTSLAIGGGALGFSLKVYRENKRKKEYPWTVAAERMGVYPLVKRLSANRLVATGKAALSQLTSQQKRLASNNTRSCSLEALSSPPDEGEIRVEEQEVNRLLVVSLGLFTITTAGLWVPALNILYLPTAIYLLSPFLKRIYTLVRDAASSVSDVGFVLVEWDAGNRSLSGLRPVWWLCLLCGA